MTNVWPSAAVPIDPAIEQIDPWGVGFGQDDRRRTDAPYEFTASAAGEVTL
jgi:hypothetical protein